MLDRFLSATPRDASRSETNQSLSRGWNATAGTLGRLRTTRDERAVMLAEAAGPRGADGQTLEGETLTLRAEAEQALLLELVEATLQGGDRDLEPLTKGSEVGAAAGAGRAEDQNQESLGERHLHVCSVSRH